MDKHTPGPWVLNKAHSTRVDLINTRKGDAIGEIVFADVRNPADARLIASAPLLLEALRDLLSATEETYDSRHEREAALDAIAKATGGEA